MGKDKNGGYVPPKGKPSGSGRETHGLKDAFAAIDPETENEIAAKYTNDHTDELANGVHVRHVNRNLHKGEDLGENNNSNNG
ncbi:hypothetical protein ABDD95_04335 [Mucilaginibacter sp. PAMB04274]|uniref:hypothetical protein n=1 Tax=Mucilaginibacter sp. PAMB04274 TaxID=3138568 RepID=UPI0031F71130